MDEIKKRRLTAGVGTLLGEGSVGAMSPLSTRKGLGPGMSNVAKKRKVWRRSEKSTERCLGELQEFYVGGYQKRVHC